jgi:deltex-like protein
MDKYDLLAREFDVLGTCRSAQYWVPNEQEEEDKGISPFEKILVSAKARPILDNTCSVCLEDFSDCFFCHCHSNKGQDNECVSLKQCFEGHFFHRKCILTALESSPKCPYCKFVYNVGRPIGGQPFGIMEIMSIDKAIPGESCPYTLVITYQFPDGIQDHRHPNPGVPYSGTIRRAFLPGGTDQSREILVKFLKAWDQRALLTVGRSMTTGKDNCVIWSGIHHKTKISGGPTVFGFPDPNYFSAVSAEFEEAGVR